MEGTGPHIHAAAALRRVVGDAAAVHMEGTAPHIHAAADAAAAGDLVAADAAAVHMERAARVHRHAAALSDVTTGDLVAADAAAVHMEGTVRVHRHAAARLAGRMGNFSGVFAVGQGEGDTAIDLNCVLAVRAGDGLAVQAEDHAVVGFPCVGECHIVGQVAFSGEVFESLLRVDRRPALTVGSMIGQVLIRQ